MTTYYREEENIKLFNVEEKKKKKNCPRDRCSIPGRVIPKTLKK